MSEFTIEDDGRVWIICLENACDSIALTLSILLSSLWRVDDDEEYFGSGWNGLLVVQDLQRETASLEEQTDSDIKVLQASELENQQHRSSNENCDSIAALREGVLAYTRNSSPEFDAELNIVVRRFSNTLDFRSLPAT